MKLSTEKTICVRPQVNMATAIVPVKDIQNPSSQLENEGIAQTGPGIVQIGRRS